MFSLENWIRLFLPIYSDLFSSFPNPLVSSSSNKGHWKVLPMASVCSKKTQVLPICKYFE
ncbi:hypothetical protein STEG23_017030, partial [Scotinomys teguina]